MEFLTERKKESHQKYNAKQVPGKGPAIARANGAPPWGQGLRPNLRCSGNCLRANIRDSVLWEQKAGAISYRASCLTAGCSWAWSAGTSACTWDPVPGWAPGTPWVGSCTLSMQLGPSAWVGSWTCRALPWARGAQPPHKRALVSVQTQEFSCVQEVLHTETPSYTLTSSLESRNLCLRNYFQHGAAADAVPAIAAASVHV